ncbi:alpha/beta hydrolase [Alkalihalophilus pseudofirmus]|nr:alpha/beta hydrolase [Alkalihalophilus pseudofirmus]
MKMFRKTDFIISEQGVSSVERVKIGGIQQSILIQTEYPGSPVLLFIHGGPSMPVPGVSNRGIDYALVTTMKELVNHFTVVFWDQRGTGKSYFKDIPRESMHLKQFLSDASDVTDYLRSRFKQEKLHLVAHSWGSVIGLYLAHQYPEKYHSYTGFSQITNWVENDKLSYKWLLEKAKETNNQKALRELAAVGEPPYTKSFKQWSVIRKWQLKYKTMFYDAGDKKSASFLTGLNIMLRSPDYSLTDIYNSLVRGFKLSYTEDLIQDINTFDFFSEVPTLKIPVMFVHGSKEQHVMSELITRYYEVLDAAKGKTFYWSEKSSHVFHYDDAKENEQRLIKHLMELHK